MEPLVISGLEALVEYGIGHVDVIKKLAADIEALFKGHGAALGNDAAIALQAGLNAAKASAQTTISMRVAAAASAAGAALASSTATQAAVQAAAAQGAVVAADRGGKSY
jgi:Skp family chaperone for outer membrane proteins